MLIKVIRHSPSNGFSLVEILLTLVIMGVAIVPLMDSITSSFESNKMNEEYTVIVNYGREKMDDVLAMDFSTVAISAPAGTPTALSDTVTVLGDTMNRDVIVALYDGDGDSIPDTNLKKIIVQIEDFQLETLMANY